MRRIGVRAKIAALVAATLAKIAHPAVVLVVGLIGVRTNMALVAGNSGENC